MGVHRTNERLSRGNPQVPPVRVRPLPWPTVTVRRGRFPTADSTSEHARVGASRRREAFLTDPEFTGQEGFPDDLRRGRTDIAPAHRSPTGRDDHANALPTNGSSA